MWSFIVNYTNSELVHYSLHMQVAMMILMLMTLMIKMQASCQVAFQRRRPL